MDLWSVENLLLSSDHPFSLPAVRQCAQPSTVSGRFRKRGVHFRFVRNGTVGKKEPFSAITPSRIRACQDNAGYFVLFDCHTRLNTMRNLSLQSTLPPKPFPSALKLSD
ncbi:hypothetical protein CEXT_328621 [Caerostris extrusa]|uniref:Uncharacterized protein n=1 Tax=Caerostris extrusa TaxID=172846 RepID=A0AAV4S2F3_CAEEX|nr:hypothetical protein CEXT_328621 [Caerostris extrusa]